MEKALVAAVYAGFFLGGCLTDPEEKKPKEIKNSVYYQYDAGFSLTLPMNWDNRLDQKVGDINIDMVSRAAPVENFAANATVLISRHSGTSDIQTVIGLIKNKSQQNSPGVEFLSDSVFVKNGVSVGKIVYRGDVLGKKLKFAQLLFVRNNLDVQIEFTDLEKYFDGRNEFAGMENSLNFF